MKLPRVSAVVTALSGLHACRMHVRSVSTARGLRLVEGVDAEGVTDVPTTTRVLERAFPGCYAVEADIHVLFLYVPPSN